MNPHGYFEQLIGVSERLIAVLNHENDLLRKHKVSGLFDLQQEKTRLSHLYENHMKKLEETPSLIDFAEAGQKARLKELAYNFEETAKENLKGLKAAHETGNRILKAIRSAVQQQQSQTANVYTPEGTSRERATESLSVSLNEKL